MVTRAVSLAIGLAVLASAVAEPASAQVTKTPAYVTRVVDGDTVEAVTGPTPAITVQLIGIDSPDVLSDGRAECGAAEATTALRALVERKSVTLVSDRLQGAVDFAGRTLAYVDLPGVDAGRRQLETGQATLLSGGGPFERQGDYVATYTTARQERTGLWAQCDGQFHQAPAPTQPAVEQPSRFDSAERFVRRYYFLLNEHRFADAWNLLSGGLRRQLGPYAGWRQGFRRMRATKVNSVSASLASGKASVHVAVRSTDADACNGRHVKQFFRGRWVLARHDGWWVATSIAVRKVGGGKVRLSKSDCKPKRAPKRPSAPSDSGGGGSGCSPSYSPCVPDVPGDIDCPDLPGTNYRVIGPDVYGLDGDNDGVACES